MSKNSKQLSNPFSTGGGGGHFEAHVQASFVALMLTGGYAPCLPCLPIKKIQLQGKYAGYNTDDVIVFVENTDTGKQGRLLGQIKHSLKITENDPTFGEVIKAAWEDFNNPEVFIKGRNIFALITGPLTVIDTNDTRTVLEWARYSDNADEFFNKVEMSNFSSNGKRKKLKAFKTNIKKANDGNDVENETIHAFLKHFHLLGFDLDIKSGVTLALMHSLIGQYSKDNAASIWTQLVNEVQSANKNGGTITPENLPEDLKEAFKQPALVHIPTELTVPPSETAPTDWSQHKYATALALANLVGAWNEQNQADISILNQITTESYSTWVGKIREVIQLSDSPISLQNGIWKIEERTSLWTALDSRIFDDHLDTFKELIVEILSERDPSFELPKEERYMASIYGKVPTHSPDLRKGLAETLALLGTRGKDLIYCSQGKAKDTAVLAIGEIFADAHDWVLWGSLNSMLPILAEAAPDEFLKAVERALGLSPCPFDELFSQEGNGITGGNYLTGLLWALEGLAWHEEYLVHVCVVLGELASHDPGGNWVNRPANSLSTILLPWLPQTIAPIEKRQVAVETLRKELPDMAWRLIIKLLSNRQTSMGFYKPSWRNPIPEDWKKGVTHQEYREQVSFYAELAVSMASEDNSRLGELIDHFDDLPKPSFERLLEVLSSDAIIGLSEDERLPLWDKLTKFTFRHRRFSKAKWALNSDLLSTIEAVADKLAPSNPLNLYQYLFSYRDLDLYEENGNWEEQRKKLNERRKKAISEILNIDGINSVIELAEAVNSPRDVGYSLGCIADAEMDKVLLPAYLETENKKLSDFVSAYIWSRRYTNGWSWADTLDKGEWSTGEIGRFLSYLPFRKETWDRTAQWLGESQGEYWAKTDANIHQADGNLSIAIDKLIEHERPHAAINCLTRMRYAKQPIDVAQSVNALLKAMSSSEPPNSIDPYEIIELIKALQENPDVNPDDLFRVEWAYLPWLDGKDGIAPKLLESRLAEDPDFFCEVIQLIYRSKKGDKIADEPSEYTKAIATNAWGLLHKWRTPPGMQSDGSFEDDEFDRWLQRVKEVCTKSGHLEMALTHLGKVLIYCPADADGLWINHRVADALNSRDSEEMRQGYQNELFNSRGVYWVDPTGKPERELAEKYRKMAHEVENAGYQRFAVTLRSLSESYDREAEHIVVRYKGDD